MKKLICYPGRFQPFGKHHYKAYKSIIQKFEQDFKRGNSDLYIVTSNKVEQDSPFNFKQKKKIIIDLFGIHNIIMTTNPYKPVQAINYYKNKINSNDFSLVVVISNKDKDRLQGGKYYQKYEQGMQLQNYRDRGYYIIVPKHGFNTGQSKITSSTQIRDKFKQQSDIKKLKQYFKIIYPKYDQQIFELFVNKLSIKKQLSTTANVSGFSTPFWHISDKKKKKIKGLYIDKGDDVENIIITRGESIMKLKNIIQQSFKSTELYDDILTYMRHQIKKRNLTDNQVIELHDLLKDFFNRWI